MASIRSRCRVSSSDRSIRKADGSTVDDRFHNERELSGKQFRKLATQATEWLGRFLDSLPEHLAWDTDGIDPQLLMVKEPLPAAGRAVAEIFALLFEKLIPTGFNTTWAGIFSVHS